MPWWGVALIIIGIIGVFDILLILGCAKLERMREEHDDKRRTCGGVPEEKPPE